MGLADLQGMKFLSTPSARRATGAACRPDRRTGGFLSTPSARRATDRIRHRQDQRSISIHALREEGDLISLSIVMAAEIFLSTPSARRATVWQKLQ